MAKEFHSTPTCVPRIPSNLLNFRIVHHPPSLSKKRRKEKKRKYSHFILFFKKRVHPPPFSFFISFRRSSSRKQTKNSCFPSTETARLLVEYAKYTSIIRLSLSLPLSLSLLYQHARTPSISVTSRRACRNLTSVVSLDCFSNGPPSSSSPLLLSETAVSSSTRHDDESASSIQSSFVQLRRSSEHASRLLNSRESRIRRISCLPDVNENHRICHLLDEISSLLRVDKRIRRIFGRN